MSRRLVDHAVPGPGHALSVGLRLSRVAKFWPAGEFINLRATTLAQSLAVLLVLKLGASKRNSLVNLPVAKRSTVEWMLSLR